MNSVLTNTLQAVNGSHATRAAVELASVAISVPEAALRSASAPADAGCAVATKAAVCPTIAVVEGENRLDIDGMGTKGYWVQTPKFGHTHHSQGWRFVT